MVFRFPLSGRGSRTKYAGIFKRFSDLQTDNEVLQEENERLFAKLERASKYIADSDRIRTGLLTERKELDDARDKAFAKVKKIKDNSREIERVSREQAAEAKLADSFAEYGEQDRVREACR